MDDRNPGGPWDAVNANALACVGDLPKAAEQACKALSVPKLALDTRAEFGGDLGARVLPTDLALILPTSGTTARPRLVPLQHRQVCLAHLELPRLTLL